MNHEDEENIEPWEKNTTTIHFNGYSFTKNNVYKNYVNYRCSAYRSVVLQPYNKNIVSGEIEQKEKNSMHTCRETVTVVTLANDYSDEMRKHAIELSLSTRQTGREIWNKVSASALEANTGKPYRGLTNVRKSFF